MTVRELKKKLEAVSDDADVFVMTASCIPEFADTIHIEDEDGVIDETGEEIRKGDVIIVTL